MCSVQSIFMGWNSASGAKKNQHHAVDFLLNYIILSTCFGVPETTLAVTGHITCNWWGNSRHWRGNTPGRFIWIGNSQAHSSCSCVWQSAERSFATSSKPKSASDTVIEHGGQRKDQLNYVRRPSLWTQTHTHTGSEHNKHSDFYICISKKLSIYLLFIYHVFKLIEHSKKKKFKI